MDRTTLARKIYATAHLAGEFRLRSGAMAHEYFDKYLFEADPALLEEIAGHLRPLVPDGTEVLAGLELGGVPLVTALAFATRLPAAFVRKSAKTYGTCKLAEGAAVAGRRVCVVEDVVTTGGQVSLSAAELRRLGADICGVLCVIERDPGGRPRLAAERLELRSLFTSADLTG